MAQGIHVFATASDGLMAELAMLDRVASGGERSFMIWRANSKALTLPERFARVDGFDAAVQGLTDAGWPVVTRRTGGGITPQGPGVLNLAIAFRVPPKDAKSVPESYAAICDPLVAALAKLGVSAKPGSVAGSFCDGDYNLEVEGRKNVGTAQRWRGASVLCHALVLVDIDLDQAVRAAQLLSDGIGLGDAYRTDAHICLSQLLPSNGSIEELFSQALCNQLEADGYTQV